MLPRGGQALAFEMPVSRPRSRASVLTWAPQPIAEQAVQYISKLL